jgi:hypothetical protein
VHYAELAQLTPTQRAELDAWVQQHESSLPQVVRAALQQHSALYDGLLGSRRKLSRWSQPATICCGGRMRLIAVLLERTAILKVLAHLDLPIASERASTRGPPDDDCFAFDIA